MTAPACCTISGTVFSAAGVAVQNAFVRARIGGRAVSADPGQALGLVWPPDVPTSNGNLMASGAVTTWTDVNGAWSLSLPQGVTYLIEIPKADVCHVGAVPSALTAAFGDLITSMQRWIG